MSTRLVSDDIALETGDIAGIQMRREDLAADGLSQFEAPVVSEAMA